jgi:protoporphyrinogen oxidase
VNSPMPNQSDLQGMKVGVLGGGITGLAAAFYLLRRGADVTVLERGAEPGGLASAFDFGPFSWDRFYHCILTSDRPLLQLISDIGLESELRWTSTKTGFFSSGKLYSMSSTLDFLRFPPLTAWEKLRLGAGILYASRIRDGKPLEAELASEWLTRIFGKENYRKMWAPLLKCKLGACRDEASAAFIWATISRLYSTREGDASRKECLGYVRGGYRTVLARLVQEIERMGGEVRTGVEAKQVYTEAGSLHVLSPNQDFKFDRIISTLPSPVLARVAPQLAPEYREKLTTVKYLGVVCFALLLRRSLTPYYVTNLIENVPFTGVIEMTNLISKGETAGRHLVYLPKYTSPGDPLFDASEESIWSTFREGLRQVVPDLKDSDIEARHLFRERFVQPIPVLHYSSIVPSMETNIEGFLTANTTQIINSTLNNNEMVKIARRATDLISRELVPARVVDTQSLSIHRPLQPARA